MLHSFDADADLHRRRAVAARQVEPNPATPGQLAEHITRPGLIPFNGLLAVGRYDVDPTQSVAEGVCVRESPGSLYDGAAERAAVNDHLPAARRFGGDRTVEVRIGDGQNLVNWGSHLKAPLCVGSGAFVHGGYADHDFTGRYFQDFAEIFSSIEAAGNA